MLDFKLKCSLKAYPLIDLIKSKEGEDLALQNEELSDIYLLKPKGIRIKIIM